MNARLEVPAGLGRDRKMASMKIEVDLLQRIDISVFASGDEKRVTAEKAAFLGRRLLLLASWLKGEIDDGAMPFTDSERRQIRDGANNVAVRETNAHWKLHLGVDGSGSKNHDAKVRDAIVSICRGVANETSASRDDELLGVVLMLRPFLTEDEWILASKHAQLFANLVRAMRVPPKPGRGNVTPEKAALEAVFSALRMPISAKQYSAGKRRQKATNKKAITR